MTATTPPRAERLPRSLTAAFGLAVVAAFGSWFYGFGVLLEPILDDTGWSEVQLSAGYGAGLLAAGTGAVVAGRVVDRLGPRPLFLTGGLLTAVATVPVVAAPSAVVFLVASVLAHGVVGAVGYYTAVHASIAVLVPADRTRAITVNTVWGAFASPVFLPLTAWLVLEVGWRATIGLTGGLVAVAFAAAGALTPPVPAREGPVAGRSFLGQVAGLARDPVIGRLLLVAVCTGMLSSVLFLYQVPAMVGAGLGLAAASTLAGVRGVFQVLGRIPLPWLVRRLGAVTVFRVGLVCSGLSALLLPATGTIVAAVGFVVVAGVAVGHFYTMESVYVADVSDVALVGTVLGVYAMVRGVGSAIGPAAAGVVTEAVGTRVPALAAVTVLAVVAALLVPGRGAVVRRG